MLEHENGYRRHKRWVEWSVRAKVASIVAGIVLIPGFLALFGAITMWLWNWLMPTIFKLPVIGFWQAVGILVLSHILFKGGHMRKAVGPRWKKERIREKMAQEEAGAKAE
jgi:hypothetical protein